MAKRIYWTKKAKINFSNVSIYLANNWSNKELNNFINEVDKVILTISENPFIGRKVGKEGFREILITKQNLIIYKVYSSKVEIFDIWDTRQHPRKKPKIN